MGPRPNSVAVLASIVIGVYLLSADGVSASPTVLDGPDVFASSAYGTWRDIAPPHRGGSKAVFDASGAQLLLIGGRAPRGGDDAYVWSLSLDGGLKWTRIGTNTDPPERLSGRAFIDQARARIVILSHDVWELSIQDWRWRKINDANGGPVVGNSSFALDPNRNQLLLFGGANRCASPRFCYFNDVWTLSLSDTGVWRRLSVDGPAPSARASARPAFDVAGDRLIIFAGAGPEGGVNDVWALDLGVEPKWSELTPNGSSPTPSLASDLLYDEQGDRLLVVAEPSPGIADVWALPLKGTTRWTKLEVSGPGPSGGFVGSTALDHVRNQLVYHDQSKGETWMLGLDSPFSWSKEASSPPPMEAHSAVYDPAGRRMVVFGGFNESGYVTEVWAKDLADGRLWSELVTRGEAPSGRAWLSAVMDPVANRMVVFGGFPWDNAVWFFSLGERNEWSVFRPSQVAPPARVGHAAIYDPIRNRMIIFGGETGLQDLDDVWALSLGGAPGWTELQPQRPGPSPRAYATGVYDSRRDRMLVFGGLLWNQIWALSLGPEPAWSQLTAVGGPDYGVFHTTVYDSIGDRMIYTGDLGMWALTLSDPPTWSDITPPLGFRGPTTLHSAIFDNVRNRMIVFGGTEGDGNDSYELSFGTDAPTPTLISFVEADVSPERVQIRWFANSLEGDPAIVYRSMGEGEWRSMASLFPDESGFLTHEDRDVQAGKRYGYRLGLRESTGEYLTDEVWVDVPNVSELSLAIRPNPARSPVVTFSLPTAEPATLEVLDLTGRRVYSRRVSGLGRHVMSVGLRLPAGVYYARLMLGSRSVSRKLVIFE